MTDDTAKDTAEDMTEDITDEGANLDMKTEATEGLTRLTTLGFSMLASAISVQYLWNLTMLG